MKHNINFSHKILANSGRNAVDLYQFQVNYSKKSLLKYVISLLIRTVHLMYIISLGDMIGGIRFSSLL